MPDIATEIFIKFHLVRPSVYTELRYVNFCNCNILWKFCISVILVLYFVNHTIFKERMDEMFVSIEYCNGLEDLEYCHTVCNKCLHSSKKACILFMFYIRNYILMGYSV